MSPTYLRLAPPRLNQAPEDAVNKCTDAEVQKKIWDMSRELAHLTQESDTQPETFCGESLANMRMQSDCIWEQVADMDDPKNIYRAVTDILCFELFTRRVEKRCQTHLLLRGSGSYSDAQRLYKHAKLRVVELRQMPLADQAVARKEFFSEVERQRARLPEQKDFAQTHTSRICQEIVECIANRPPEPEPEPLIYPTKDLCAQFDRMLDGKMSVLKEIEHDLGLIDEQLLTYCRESFLPDRDPLDFKQKLHFCSQHCDSLEDRIRAHKQLAQNPDDIDLAEALMIRIDGVRNSITDFHEVHDSSTKAIRILAQFLHADTEYERQYYFHQVADAIHELEPRGVKTPRYQQKVYCTIFKILAKHDPRV